MAEKIPPLGELLADMAGAALPEAPAAPEAPAEEAPAEETPPAEPEAPPPPRYYRVLTPNAEFAGKRFRFEFAHGECIIPADATVEFDAARGAATQTLARELFATHFKYRVEPIPAGEPPLPRHVAQDPAV